MYIYIYQIIKTSYNNLKFISIRRAMPRRRICCISRQAARGPPMMVRDTIARNAPENVMYVVGGAYI